MINTKQLDIYGNEIELIDIPPTRKTIKDIFREKYGYLHGKCCRNCKHHHILEYHYKNYHKCEKLGISNSEATDIRLKDVACNLYEEV